MLNQELELSLNMAFARAREHRHEFMTVEHLLLALLTNPAAREALEACAVDLAALRRAGELYRADYAVASRGTVSEILSLP